MRQTKRILCSILILSLLVFLWGCASLGTTKPNIPYRGACPDSFVLIQQANPLLATELMKLPEMQDGISENELVALRKIVELYNNSPAAFDKTFDQMYKVGLPDVRRYCSPLQALFWLAEDGKYDELVSSVNNYSLINLLKNAWDFNFHAYKEKVLDITKKQADEIISNLGGDEQKIYEGITEPHVLNYVILRRYCDNSHRFPKKTRPFIEEALKKAEQSKFMVRWGTFNTVIERLNSPELLDYYERSRIHYSYASGHGEDRSEVGYVFKYNKGHCAQITAFTVHVFKRNGYKAWRSVIADKRFTSPKGNYHRVCVFIANGKKFVMDNGRPAPLGIVPYDQYKIDRPPYLSGKAFEEAWQYLQ
jgi:hypothetical protein